LLSTLPQPRFVVEGSNWGWKSAHLPEGKRIQQQHKAKLQIDALTLGKVDAMGIGSGDLALGLDWLKEQKAPFVLSNLNCGDEDPWKSFLQVERGDVTVGVTSFISKNAKVPSGCTIDAPEDVLKEMVTSKSVDVWLLSSELSEEENRALSTLVPRSIFIDAKTRRMLDTPKQLTTDSVLLASGSRGKHVGVASLKIPKDSKGVDIVGLQKSIEKEKKRYEERILKGKKDREGEKNPEKRKRLEKQIDFYTQKIEKLPKSMAVGSNVWTVDHRLHSLDRSLADDRKTEALVVRHKEYVEAEGKKLNEVYVGPFIGSKSCRGCHPSQYAHWETTAHALAWKTLVDVQRSQDDSCFSCHVTGAHHEQGPQSPSAAQGLENVGCESCHGPGADHVQSSGQIDMIKEPTLSNCTQCHDGVKDEGRFDGLVYYPKIRHPSLQSGDEQ
jgi:hypothetical protein